MALVTLAEIKTHTGITGTSDDARLNQLNDQISTLFATKTGQDFSVQQRIDYFNGHEGDGVLLLRHPPVISIASITKNTDAVDLTETTIEKDTGVLRLGLKTSAVNSIWDGDIVVTYISGYTSIPSDLKLAALELITEIFENPGGSALQSAKMGDYSFSKFRQMANEAMSPFVREVLSNYSLIN